MSEKSKIKINCVNCSKKYLKKYKKFFKDEEVVLAEKIIDGMKNKDDEKINEKLYKDYLFFKYLYDNGGLIIEGNFEFIESLDNFFVNDFFISYKDVENISTNLIYAREKMNL